jgi:L,D-transpeptidase YbiS
VTVLYVNTQDKTLSLYRRQRRLKRYVIQTAANGLGEIQDSEKTPRGWHRIVSRHGLGCDAFAVLRSREATGEIFKPSMLAQYPQRDWILARVLRLAGLEPGLNQGEGVDSLARMIYVHGAPESLMLSHNEGSHGCVRMFPHDVVELATQVSAGDKLLIV